MKNLKFLFLLAFALLLATPAFALQCKDGQYAASDECWTDVRISTVETTRVIPGVVLEYSAPTDSAEENGYTVRVANASADYAAIAGVAQTNIATGDYGRILVRGSGKIRKANGVVASTRDYLYPTASGDAGGIGASGASPIAWTRSATTAAPATIDAYIIVV